MAFVEVQSIRKVFSAPGGRAPVVAIEDATFRFEAGEFVSLLGPSGCGKTTVLRIIAGLVAKTSGSVRVDDEEVVEPRASVGFVFQQPNLMPWRTVLDNVLFPAEILRLRNAKTKARARDLLAMVGLSEFEQARPHQLSGGMQQRVALCRALVHEPTLLLMDEPFGALDELTRMEMNDLLLEVRRQTKASVAFVTHSIAEAVYLADQVVVFTKRPGRIAEIISVDLPYPRFARTRYSPAFTALEHRASRALGVIREGRTSMVEATRDTAAGQDGIPAGSARRFDQLKPILYPPLGIALTVLAWQLACVHFNLPTAVLPKPGEVLAAAISRADLLWSEGIVTLKETVYGFLLALALGVPLAVAITSSRTLNLMLYPILIALQSVPKVALAPILLVWLGTGIEFKLAIAWLVAFFPIVVDTAAGLQSTPPALIELARSLKATWWQIFFKVKLPASLPFIITGSKVAVTLAVIGAVIGEFIGSSEGLGYLLLTATSQLDTPLAFASLFALAALGILVYLAVVLAEWLLAPLLPHTPGNE